MLDKYMDYGVKKDLPVEDLKTLHDDFNYAVIINDGKIVDFVYEGKE